MSTTWKIFSFFKVTKKKNGTLFGIDGRFREKPTQAGSGFALDQDPQRNR
jgi:hypothetical protein